MGVLVQTSLLTAPSFTPLSVQRGLPVADAAVVVVALDGPHSQMWSDDPPALSSQVGYLTLRTQLLLSSYWARHEKPYAAQYLPSKQPWRFRSFS